MSSPDFFEELERHLDRAAHRQARYGRLATAPFPSAAAVLAVVLVALVVGAGAYALPRLAGSEDEVASPPTPRGAEAITVTPDLIQLGEGLVGVGVARSGGRLYVLAGRYRTETDRFFTPKTAVLAAFDDAGTELWRTELDRQPAEVQVVDGDPWVTLGQCCRPGPLRLVKVDAQDGHVLGGARIQVGDGRTDGGGQALHPRDHFFEAFGALWVTRREASVDGTLRSAQMVRMDPDDLSVTRLDVPFHQGDCGGDDGPAEQQCPEEPRAGAGAIWAPLKDNGVAMIDPDTNDVTVIGAEELGHPVLKVAFDGDVAYVASSDRVSSIVEGEVVATASVGEISEVTYLGPVDGTFGVVDPSKQRLRVLKADDPMVVESRLVSAGTMFELHGEAWQEFGRNYSFRRVQILP